MSFLLPICSYAMTEEISGPSTTDWFTVKLFATNLYIDFGLFFSMLRGILMVWYTTIIKIVHKDSFNFIFIFMEHYFFSNKCHSLCQHRARNWLSKIPLKSHIPFEKFFFKRCFRRVTSLNCNFLEDSKALWVWIPNGLLIDLNCMQSSLIISWMVSSWERQCK